MTVAHASKTRIALVAARLDGLNIVVLVNPSGLGYIPMTTLWIGGVRFKIYPQDHTPRHVHGLYQGVEVIFDLRKDLTVALADRKDSVQPGNAKRNQVKHVLNVAAENFDALVAAWEAMHK